MSHPTPRPQRRLAAILFADMVGYTRLMEESEARALRLRDEFHHLASESIPAYSGEMVKTMGDGFFAAFNSAVEAVRYALAFQKTLATRNQENQGQPPLLSRIGIHVGDLIQEGNDLFGSGVNVASRIEPLATPGGICISGEVYQQVRNQEGFSFSDLGERSLHNLQEPVRVYFVEPAEEEGNMKPPEIAADPRAIAVLPFENISPEKENDYFSDGLTEELIANLSRLKDARVVSRTTSMQYKATKKDIKTIGRELGVRYIMEGSVRKFQDNLRITAQLIDVETDAQLWAETYKGHLADIFDIQEQVSRQIVDALTLKLTPIEKVALTKRATLNPEAYDLYLRGRDQLYRFTKSSVQLAIQLFQKATELDPRYAAAYAGLGEAYGTWYQRFERKDVWLEKAIESSLKALMYDTTLSEAYASLGLAYFNKGALDDALTATQKAIELDPDNFTAYWILGRIYHTTDRDREAIDLLKKVLELNPDLYAAYGDLAIVYERLGEEDNYAQNLQSALRFYPRYLSQHPDDARAHMFFAVFLARAEKSDEAKAAAAKALELSPDDPNMLYNAACFYAQLGEKRLALEALRNAVTTGFEYYEWIKRDPDLEPIRHEPEYQELMKGK
ncbi:MAG: tetratricopeptide repeat protein [Chloroflexi bacterium]|nr:tetratricopeptide repeat protein [Chloroflexota bacterium]